MKCDIKTRHVEFNCETWRMYVRIGKFYLGIGWMGY